LNRIAWIIFALGTVGILALLIILSGNSRVDVSTIDSNVIQVANSENGNIADHVFGNSDSKVIFINYGDFQCPACGQASPRIKAVVEEYKDQIQFVFRNFPITTSHPNAKAAAGVAEAAGLQGKYWEMYYKIYESQSAWSNLSGTSSERTDFFVGYANELGLDITKFKADLASSAVSEKINYDYSLGKKDGVNSTPTFFLDGEQLELAVWSDTTKLKEAINVELKKADIELPK